MQGKEKQPSPNNSSCTSSLPSRHAVFFLLQVGDTILIVTAPGFHDLIMTVLAFHKRCIIYVFVNKLTQHLRLSTRWSYTKTAHIWNPWQTRTLASPKVLPHPFASEKIPPLLSWKDSGGFPWGQNQNQVPLLTLQTLMCRTTRTQSWPLWTKPNLEGSRKTLTYDNRSW